jgi:hypothetical protein
MTNESMPIVGGGDRKRKPSDGLGIPDDPRFLLDRDVSNVVNRICAEGEGEG